MNPNAQTAVQPLILRDCTINLRIGGTDHNRHGSLFPLASAPLSATVESFDFGGASSASAAADAQVDTDLPRFVKVSAEGKAMPDDASDHACVWDRQNGLLWSHTLGDDRMTHAAAEKACADFDLVGLAGWRLPSRMELESILDLTRHDPAIDTSFFPDTKAAYYWSGCRLAAGPDCAWVVDFDRGGVSDGHRDGGARVRAVRVASAPPRQ
jgi:hypothetical protein